MGPKPEEAQQITDAIFSSVTRWRHASRNSGPPTLVYDPGWSDPFACRSRLWLANADAALTDQWLDAVQVVVQNSRALNNFCEIETDSVPKQSRKSQDRVETDSVRKSICRSERKIMAHSCIQTSCRPVVCRRDARTSNTSLSLYPLIRLTSS